MRTCYDAVTISRIPANAQMVAGYIGGNYPTFGQLAARFPHAARVSIAVNATHDAHVLDVEQGDATPDDAPAWALRQRVMGGFPTVYCSESVWPQVVAAFERAHVALPMCWQAHYDGIASLPPGCIAKQYSGGMTAPYDISVVADYWPGVDPLPEAPDMTPLESQQLTNVSAAVGRLEVAVEDPTGGVRAQIASLEATVNRIAGKLGV